MQIRVHYNRHSDTRTRTRIIVNAAFAMIHTGTCFSRGYSYEWSLFEWIIRGHSLVARIIYAYSYSLPKYSAHIETTGTSANCTHTVPLEYMQIHVH